MRIESQVCSYSSGMKLKMLGIKQDGLFWWVISLLEDEQVIPTKFVVIEALDNNILDGEECCAFTSAELGEILPLYVKSSRLFDTGPWVCSWGGISCKSTYESEARALLLIELIEKNFLSVIDGIPKAYARG